LPTSFVNEARVIAVTTEPPEATPGAHVTFTPTVVAVGGDLSSPSTFTAQWWRCPDSDSDALGDDDQCTDPSTRKVIASGVPFDDTVPADLFGDLTQAQQSGKLSSPKILGALLGYWRVIGFTTSSPVKAGKNRVVDGFKREPIFLPGHLGDVDPKLTALDEHIDLQGNPVPPNANPLFSAVLIHEDTVTGGTTTTIDKHKTYFFDPVYDDRSLESYISLKVDLTGLDLSDPASIQALSLDQIIARFSKVQRCEIPTFNWYVTAGKVERDDTLDEGALQRVYDPRGVDCPAVEGEPRLPQVQYTPPTNATSDPQDQIPKDGVVHAWCVMRDGRGGTAVRSFDFTVE
jgi:hypothetical protein